MFNLHHHELNPDRSELKVQCQHELYGLKQTDIRPVIQIVVATSTVVPVTVTYIGNISVPLCYVLVNNVNYLRKYLYGN